MLEPIAPAKNKTDKTVLMVFISLSFPLRPLSLAFVPCDMAAREKIPAKKYCYEEFFAWTQSFKNMDNVLDFCAEEALATLFQPDTVAAAEYFKSYERTLGLEAEKNLCSRCWKALSKISRSMSLHENPSAKHLFQEAEEWLLDKDGEGLFSFENICETLGLHADHIRKGLMI